MQIVIDKKGRVTDVSVLSPLGFGLDEQAQAAVTKWEFAPGMKAGSPVKTLTAEQSKWVASLKGQIVRK